MSILFLLIPLAVVLGGAAIALLVWALTSGQYDDLDAPGERLLLDDDSAPRPIGEREPRGG
ncbi:MAG: cbb3-type cytochrome oxidase assembly protein CcoS [Pseudomonadota bacterium]